ncbi:MAG: hypothetical protein A2289_16260 [Deltaproteobacteria bacterium RIFOXYA12_FULL_58_15]|nr:MAG: hypothetical protein A2289_16260 [Deltaproteobacteria bacterium RIFOXYA12_FULL_58_15]OGR09952.1 MAG: hypothetical protein A2341_12325 [Deltaproteobacteria bacterium RIFOXYB12_FULL_58_9]
MLNFVREQAFRAYKDIEVREHCLLYLFLEITRRCNLNCLHCGSDCTANTDAPELTTESWLKIISYVKEHFGDKVAFVITGGEPLVHPDLKSIVSHINRLGMRWGMVTNGMSLNKTWLDQLIDRGLYSITLSLDGTRDAHNELRNHKLAFDKVTGALELLGKSSIEMMDAVTCVYPGNLKQLDEIGQILLANGIPAWRLFRIFPSGRAANNSRLLMTHEQTWEMLDWIAERRPFYAEKGLKVGASCEGYVPFKQDRAIRDFPFFCRAGVNMASILCDGTITGCTNNHHSFYQGNILRDSFADVWQTRFAAYRRRDWIKKTNCSTCSDVKKCEGGSIHLWKLGDAEPAFCYLKKKANQ